MAILDDCKVILDIEDTNTKEISKLNIHIRTAATGIKSYMNVDGEVSELYPDAVMKYAIYLYQNEGEENTNYSMQGQRVRMSNKYNSLPEHIKILLPPPYVKMMG